MYMYSESSVVFEIQCTFTIIQYCIIYVYNMAVGLVIYSKARAFEVKARESQGQGQGLTSLLTDRFNCLNLRTNIDR